MDKKSKSGEKNTQRLQLGHLSAAVMNLEGSVLKIALLLAETAEEHKTETIEYSYTDIADLTGMTVMQVSRAVKRLAETVDIDVIVGDHSGKKTVFDVSRQPWMTRWREGDEWYTNILRRQAEAFVAMYYMLLSRQPEEHWIAEMHDETAGTDTFMDTINVSCDVENMVMLLNSVANDFEKRHPGYSDENIISFLMQGMYVYQSQYFGKKREDYTFESFVEQCGPELKQRLEKAVSAGVNHE